MTDMNSAIRYAEERKSENLEDLISLLKIPSISTLSEHRSDILLAANWIADQLRQFGFENVDLLPTDRHPVVYGEHMQAGPGAPTILFYGHYDVQPVDPLDEWESKPFEPAIRGDDIYARGASDMKGQIMAHLKAVDAMVNTSGLPVNLKYMIEGEEEIGSPNLEKFVQRNREILTCDLCLNGDSGILAADEPAITFSLRGMAYFEIRLQGTRSDLHSGTFGGVVDNPARVLSSLIAGMKDENGRILLPGFYDHVREITDEDRRVTFSQSDEWWLEQAGARSLFGESGYSVSERATARPTLDVNGFLSGFTGEGSKTVLPAHAMAKISTRLVPDQTPEHAFACMERYLKEHAPETVTWELEMLSKAKPAIAERDSPAVVAAMGALSEVWGKQPVFLRAGGTIPVVGLLKDELGVDNLLLGFGLPDDNLHAPNEKFHLPNFYRGIETFIRFTHQFAG
jgi:acetylornithine deacetylase/succinyl-diaminopimelate desuccinylase-like protein